MKFNSKYFKFVIISIISIIVVPIFMDFFIIGNNFSSNINNSDWVGFLGNYIGSIIGSLTTLIGILITLNFTKHETAEDRRLLVSPYLKFNIGDTKFNIKHDIEISSFIDRDDNTKINATVSIKNIGMGPLLDFEIDDVNFNGQTSPHAGYENYAILEKGDEWLMLIDLRLRLEKIPNDELLKSLPGSLVELYPPEKYMNRGGILSIHIRYRDLIGNQYKQDIKIQMNIEVTTNDKNGLNWEYLSSPLRIMDIGKCCVITR